MKIENDDYKSLQILLVVSSDELVTMIMVIVVLMKKNKKNEGDCGVDDQNSVQMKVYNNHDDDDDGHYCVDNQHLKVKYFSSQKEAASQVKVVRVKKSAEAGIMIIGQSASVP